MPKKPSLKAAAKRVAAAGRKGDTELVHVTKEEKAVLKAMGGSGSTNPLTDLKEFFFGGATGSLGSAAGTTDFSGRDSGADEQRERRQQTGQQLVDQERQLFDEGVSPTDENARGNLTDTQRTAARGLRLAAGLIIPGAGLVSGAGRALQFLFGPGDNPEFQAAGTSGVQRPGAVTGTTQPGADIGFSRDSAEFQTRSGAPTAARILSRSENTARTRTENADTANVTSERTQQAAAVARRRATDIRSQTVLTSLRGLFGGSGFAKKRLLGQ